jgi:Uma2 family endonuclease
MTADERASFGPVCPEFVVEVKSRSDSLRRLKLKMQEYIENGAELGWLIVPKSRTVFIYRPGVPEETLVGVSKLAGEGPVAGFELDLTEIWPEN